MKPELEKQLADKYPKIFADKSKTPMESLMCFGCCCGDGWYDLIDALCHQLQQTTDEDPEEQPQVVAFQIKEKFGTLRFYSNATSDMQHGFIRLVESLSSHVCEVCGTTSMGSTKNVKLRDGPWIRTLCDACEEKCKFAKVVTDIQKNKSDEDS